MNELKPRKMSEFQEASKRVKEMQIKGITPEMQFSVDLKLKPKNNLMDFSNELNPREFAKQHEQILKASSPQEEILKLRKRN
ncbi:MAG: hypothetical protein ABIA76_05420 [Candidatus Diapherotrites archaeon]